MDYETTHCTWEMASARKLIVLLCVVAYSLMSTHTLTKPCTVYQNLHIQTFLAAIELYFVFHGHKKEILVYG